MFLTPTRSDVLLHVCIFDSVLRNDDVMVSCVIKHQMGPTPLVFILVLAVGTVSFWHVDPSSVTNQGSSSSATGVTGYLHQIPPGPVLCFLSPSRPGAGPQQTPFLCGAGPQLEDRSHTNTQMVSGERLLFQHDRK